MLTDCKDENERAIYVEEHAALEGRPEAAREKHAMACVEIYRREMSNLANLSFVDRQFWAKHAVQREREMRVGGLKPTLGRPSNAQKRQRAMPKAVDEAVGEAVAPEPRKELHLPEDCPVPAGMPINAGELCTEIVVWACQAAGVPVAAFRERDSKRARRLASIACVNAVKNRRLAAEILGLRPSTVGSMCTRAHYTDVDIALTFSLVLKVEWATLSPMKVIAD